jgi:hypothetical protein
MKTLRNEALLHNEDFVKKNRTKSQMLIIK